MRVIMRLRRNNFNDVRSTLTLGQAKPILDRPNVVYGDLQQAGTLALAEVTTSRATPSPDATSRRSLSTWLWMTVEDKFDHVDIFSILFSFASVTYFKEDCESNRKKDGKEGFDGSCHRANRYKLPPLLPPTKC